MTEWQYTSKGAGAILEPRAQLAIWLDYPWQVARRRLVSPAETEAWLREQPLRRHPGPAAKHD
ncbi:hypothetical protein ACI1US_00307 [Leucobacter sp. BZR 635]|uniref:hypothetical protein n=1 Tax=Leucobacter sp. BZR 635 TaxID=3378705 RepID=UPI003A86E88A